MGNEYHNRIISNEDIKDFLKREKVTLVEENGTLKISGEAQRKKKNGKIFDIGWIWHIKFRAGFLENEEESLWIYDNQVENLTVVSEEILSDKYSCRLQMKKINFQRSFLKALVVQKCKTFVPFFGDYGLVYNQFTSRVYAVGLKKDKETKMTWDYDFFIKRLTKSLLPDEIQRLEEKCISIASQHIANEKRNKEYYDK